MRRSHWSKGERASYFLCRKISRIKVGNVKMHVHALATVMATCASAKKKMRIETIRGAGFVCVNLIRKEAMATSPVLVTASIHVKPAITVDDIKTFMAFTRYNPVQSL